MPNPRLGPSQRATLAAIACPSSVLLTPCKSDLRLIDHGFAQYVLDGPDICITPAGLRRLAADIESGAIKGAVALAAQRRGVPR